MATLFFCTLSLFQTARRQLEESYSDANAVGRVCGIVFLFVIVVALIFGIKFLARKLRKDKGNYDENTGLKL